MSDTPYSKREIDGFQHDVRDSLSRIEVDMHNGFEEVHKRQDKTNGRVTGLERWQYAFMGGITVLSVIVIPLLAWALYTLSNIQQTVHQSVSEALSAYNIK